MVGGRSNPHALRHGIARPGPDDTAAAGDASDPSSARPSRRPPRSPGRRSSARAPGGGPAEGPRRLYRSRDERVIGGVCGGLAEYFGIDPLIVRIITVGLVFAGGAGFLAYLAAWLLVPDADGASVADGNGRLATIAGTVLLVLAIGTVLPFWHGPFGGWGWGGPLVSLICLGLAGLGVWWVASGEHPAASGTRDILRRAGFGVALLAVCGLLALGGAWATAAGGGVIVAGVVIVAGLWLVAGAFLGGARWLILPALALALPAGVVSAANLDVDGGVGDREYRPAIASEIRSTYKLGVGHLILDLRDTKLPPRRPPHPPRDRRGRGLDRRAAQRVRDEQGARRRRPGQRVRPRVRRPRRRLARRPAGAPGHDPADRRRQRRRRRPRRHVRQSQRSLRRPPLRRRPRARQRRLHRGRPWLGATWTSPPSSPASPSSCSGSCLLLDRLDVVSLRFASLGPLACATIGAVLLASGLGRRD